MNEKLFSRFFSLYLEQSWTTVKDCEWPWKPVFDRDLLQTIVTDCERPWIRLRSGWSCSRLFTEKIPPIDNDREQSQTTMTTRINFKRPKTTTNDHEREIVFNTFVSLYREMIVNKNKRLWTTVIDCERPWTTMIDYKQLYTTVKTREREVFLKTFVPLYRKMIMNDYKQPWTTMNDHDRRQMIVNNRVQPWMRSRFW